MSTLARIFQPAFNIAWRAFNGSNLETTPQVRTPYRPRQAKRSFAAGEVNRFNGDWSTTPETPDQIVWKQLRTLRARSREQCRGNDYGRRFINLLKAHVIGENGIRFQSRVLGMDGKADKLARQAIEEARKDWQKAKNCHFQGSLHDIEQQNLVIATIAMDGECFIRTRMNGPYLHQREFIDAEAIDVALNEQLRNGNMIRFGIEFDPADRAVAYHVTSKSDHKDAWVSPYTSREYIRIPAEEIQHLFLVESIGQRRGLPWLSTSLQRMKMLNAMEDAALIAARIGASKMGFFSNQPDNSAPTKYEGHARDADDLPVMNVEPGTFENIGNLKFEQFDPDYPKGEFEVFVMTQLRAIASGMNVSYNTWANDLRGVNFSAMRHGVIEDREAYKTIQAWLIRQWIEGDFETWFTHQYTLRTITIPSRKGGRIPLSRGVEHYLKARFQPRRWQWVDILKEVNAKKEEISLGLTSISRVIREMGHDPDEVFEEIKTERETLKEMGILPAILDELNKEGEPNAEEENPDSDGDAEAGEDDDGDVPPNADDSEGK